MEVELEEWSWLPTILLLAETRRAKTTWAAPGSGQWQGTAWKWQYLRINSGREENQGGRKIFGTGRRRGAVTVICIILEPGGSSWGKSLADLVFGTPRKARAILHWSIYNLNRKWIGKITYSPLWFLRQVNRRRLNLSDSSRVTWGFCSTAGNKPR